MMAGDDIIIQACERRICSAHLPTSCSECWRLSFAIQTWRCYSADIIFSISKLFFCSDLYHFSSRGNDITVLEDKHYAQPCHFVFEGVHSVFNLRGVCIWATSCERDTAVLPLFLHLVVVLVCCEFSVSFFFPKGYSLKTIASLQLVVVAWIAKLSPRTRSLLKWVFL